MFEFAHRISHAGIEAIESRASYIWENLLYSLENGSIETLEELEDEIDEHMSDGTNAVNLDLEERLSVCEYLAEETGNEEVYVKTWDDIRSAIESTADACIEEYAKSSCREALEELNERVEDLGLSLSDVKSENGFAWAVHQSERDEEDARVYEYRGIEGGEIDVDVWEIEVVPGFDVYLNVYLAKEGGDQ